MELPQAKKNLINHLQLWLAKIKEKIFSQHSVLPILLKNTQLFNHLTTTEFNSLIHSVKSIHFKKDAIIFHQDDVADYFYLIKDGSIRIYIPHEKENEIVLARLETGDYFGEQALLDTSPGKRSASAKALKNTTLYAISHAVYSTILNTEIKSTLKQLGEKQLIDKLEKQLIAIQCIKAEVLKNFAGETITYTDNDIIFKINDEAHSAYFILSGHVVIEFPNESQKISMTELGPGQLFGELAILKKTGRKGTARAKGKVVVLSINYDVFKKLYETSPELQQLVSSMSNVYSIKHLGVVNLFFGSFLDMPAISTIYHLQNGRSVMSTRVIGKPIFTMSYNDAPNTMTLRFRRGKTIKRELGIHNNHILSIVSVGEWNELSEICNFLLNEKTITTEQMMLFAQDGVISHPAKKTILSDERDEILCFCMHVSKGQVFDTITEGITQIDEVSKKTGASSVCGSCRPNIVELLGMRAWTTINVIEMISLHPDICAFRLQGKQVIQNYQPGQHIVIQALINNQLISRNYTITSISGHHAFVEIIVKKEPQGYFSHWLFANAKNNILIRISDPQGHFVLNESSDVPIVFLVGGIGVTPALAFARFITLTNSKQRLHIDYSARTKNDFILVEEWNNMARSHQNMSIHFRDTQENGKIDQQEVSRLTSTFPNADFYICGPKTYGNAVINYLTALNIAPHKIKTEEFTHAGGQ
jgi:ferredoxin-NADP reductase/CRP-like cAMP-binding protein